MSFTYFIIALNMLIIVILNSLSGISKICAVSDYGSDNCFVSSNCFSYLLAWLMIVVSKA